MQHQALDDLLTALDVRLKAFAICEIGSDCRLQVDPLDVVICHFVVRGHGYFELADRRVPISAGSIIIVPPGTRKSISGPGQVQHEVLASESCDTDANGLLVFRACSDHASLVLGCATLGATWGGSLSLFTSLREPLFASLGGHALFASGFDPLVQELTDPKIGRMAVAECLLKQALVLLLREQQNAGDHAELLEQLGDERLLRATAAMIKAPAEQHDIESLSRLSGMSRSSFMAHFTRQYGRTPGEFLQTVRLNAAARLLASSEMSIKCVAASVGYASRSQFSRAFKDAFRIDPSAYRTQYSSAPAVCHEMALDPDVFITDALAMRPVKYENLRHEKAAIQQLAERMADDPADVLPHFVALAMKLTDAESAGLSIFDRKMAPDVFEWRCLHGLLAPFEKATTPRNHSPCGVTLDVNRPMLLTHPERIYDWIAAEDLIVPEVLLVPLYVAGEPLGTLWVVAADEGHFDRSHARLLSELATFVGIALKMERTNNKLRRAIRERETQHHPVERPANDFAFDADARDEVSERRAEMQAAQVQLSS